MNKKCRLMRRVRWMVIGMATATVFQAGTCAPADPFTTLGQLTVVESLLPLFGGGLGLGLTGP